MSNGPRIAMCAGQTLRRRELLSHRGLKLVTVPFDDWQKLPSCPTARQQYMHERLRAAKVTITT